MVGRLRAYMAVVSTIGFVVLALLAVSVDLDRVRDSLPAGAMLALVVLVAPFLSIPLSRDGRGPSLHVDTPFVFALVLAAGAGAAALVMAASGLLYDLAHRKPFSKVAFNNGIHTIGLAAGALVWTTLAGGQVTGSSALPAILTGTAVFVAVKMALFGVYLTLDESVRPVVSPSRFLRHVLLVIVMAQVGVLVLVLAAERPALLLLALGPMLAAYLLLRSESRAVLARQDAEATARREAELRAQEQEVARKLKETDQMKDDLLAMVSHELRTPLTTVVGALRLLSDRPGLNPGERQEMLEMADRQARRLRVLIEQLLLAAQSDNGRATFLSAASERVEVDAAELLAEAAIEAEAGPCGDRVRVRCEQRLPVRLAPDPVLQIVGNLVDNACKYAPEDSPVWLIGERHGAKAVLAVEDEGGGVPAAERERIFERFTRLEPGRGLGLGLYIARQLARAQGGDLVAADARVAGGARFELRLPLRERALSASVGASTP
ncbi:MAG TPA: HAMP domain-containing sensor histidine kinase, partial [Actinomycetota bacterium]|nr:HAMP domain-containing sensor histidine kinase [Actinomycetota bacterium]